MALGGILRKSSKPRVMVVGVDGVPHSLVEKLCDQGVLPFISQLSRMSAARRMKVTLPEISSVSWPSFMTGSNPGVHGIFGFTDLKPGSYSLVFPCFSDLKCPTFWDRLGERGKKSVVINQPGTYPARAIPGALVSGFVAIDLMKSIYPLRNLAALRRMDYQIDIDTQRCRKDHNQLFTELSSTLEAREKIVDHFWPQEDWDYFQVVVTGTDRLQHYLWSAVEDSSHPRHSQAMDYYASVDKFIGKMWKKFQSLTKTDKEGENFFLLSDHGFCGIKQEVNLNAWLREKGFLDFASADPGGIEDISPSSKAFALDPSRIYLHLEGKFPKGGLKPEDSGEVINDIEDGLMKLEFEGQRVIQMVKARDEIYSGPESARGPDLVVVSNQGFDLKAAPAAKQVFELKDLSGMHTWDDAFFWSLEPVKDDLVITDLEEIVTAPLK